MKVWKPSPSEKVAASSWEIWTKEVSEFNWYYNDTETCLILEGEAEVTDKKGNKIHFKPGDMVRFEQGLECTWLILKKIKKHYMFG